MFLSELNAQTAESIRVHHASGHFTRDEVSPASPRSATTRSWSTRSCSWPVTDDQFAQHRTWPKGRVR